MARRPALILVCLAALAACSNEQEDATTMTRSYPDTPVVEQVDDYHGTEVADPYRWLEDDVRENPEVKRWVEQQNEITFAYLATIEERAAIEKRLTELWDFERYGLPTKAGDRYFYTYNDGLQNQEVIYTLESLDDEARLLIDPNTWSEDGTIALAAFYPSPDGRYLAYLVQDGGSDWREARVLDVETGEVLDDRLVWLKFTNLDWAGDSSGFYYSRYPEVAEQELFQSLNKNNSVHFHAIGTEQSDDELVYARPDQPDWRFDASVTDDGNHLVIANGIGTDDRYQIFYKDLRRPDSDVVLMIEGFDYDYTLVDSVGDELYFRTNNGAPRNRIVAIDPSTPEPQTWREVIAEQQDVLSQASLVGGRLIGEYMQDAWSVVKVFDLTGEQVGNVDLPGIGTAYGFSGRFDDAETFFGYTSFDTPPTINRLDVVSGEVSVFRAPDVAFDPDDYVVEQVFFESKDGTRVPMFIGRRRDVTPDGNRPTMLYGYGGFNISLTPGFSITRLAWMEMGGIYAVANLRGGGEYGREWHQAGTKLNK